MELEPLVALIVGFATLILGLFQYLQAFLKKYENLLDTNDKIQDARTAQELENMRLKYEIENLQKSLKTLRKSYAQCKEANVKLRALVQKYKIEMELYRTKKSGQIG